MVSDDRNGVANACEHGRIIPVVLSGGAGTRLWPFSTDETPKQFLPLLSNGESLYGQALKRVQDRSTFESPIVVASLRHADACEKELTSGDSGAQLILEPCGRNTAPAIVLAALAAIERHGEDALMLVMPSDHLIERVDEFHEAVTKGVAAASAGNMVTFGIRPTSPDTGYGYLQMGNEVNGAPGVHTVARFVEKPKMEAAKEMYAGGNHLWNAGIFLFRAGSVLDQANEHARAIVEATTAAFRAAERTGNRLIPDKDCFAQSPSESIDYAVMEVATSVVTVPMAPGWSDLGSWDALAALEDGGQSFGPITAVDCENCYIRTDSVRVAALGLQDLIIVVSGGRLLILPRGRSQEVKKLLSAMDSLAA